MSEEPQSNSTPNEPTNSKTQLSQSVVRHQLNTTTSQPLAVKPKSQSGKKWSLGLIVVAAFALLIVGSAGAYFGVVVPNKPENVLKKSAIQSAEQTKYKFDGKGTIEMSGSEVQGAPNSFDFTFSGQVDLDNSALQAKIGLNILGIKPVVELSKIDGSVFFNVGDLSQLRSLSQLASPESTALLNELNKRIGNQWVEVDKSLFKQAKPGSECLLDYPKPFPKQDIDFLANQYKNSEFIDMKSTSSETLNGRTVLKYDIVFKQDKLNEYSKDIFKNVSIFKSFGECLEKISGQKLDQLIDKQPTNQQLQQVTSMTLWVDKKSKTLSRLQATSVAKQGTMEAKTTFESTYEYGRVSITKPDNAKPLMQVLGDLKELFGSNLTGSTTAPPAITNLENVSPACLNAIQEYANSRGTTPIPAGCL